MKTFKDKNGKEWQIELTIGSAKRVRDYADADLISPKVGETVAKLSSNPELLVNTLYALCKPQCEAADPKISEEGFAEAFNGKAIEDATTALVDEICVFSQSPGVRQALKEIHSRTTKLIESKAAEVLAKIRGGAIERQVEDELKRAEAKTLGGSSTASPASSASTPTA